MKSCRVLVVSKMRGESGLTIVQLGLIMGRGSCSNCVYVHAIMHGI